MIAATAKSHFTADIARARALYDLALAQPAGTPRDDLLRSSWMFAVGACDAFVCDAYVDLLAKTMRAKDMQRAVSLPTSIDHIEIPLGTVFHNRQHAGWEWRMFARGVMERDNVLSIKKIKELFNPFFRERHKILTEDTIERWITHQNSKQRLLGITAPAYRASRHKGNDRKNAIKHLETRFSEIYQRRHDCIHNCDRPRIALQRIGDVQTQKVIDDIDFLVERCYEDVTGEFPTWLATLGFNAATRSAVTI